ncbi:hypothetical protein HBE96_00485 [Clostridium sp. P21]|uniref:Phage-Barnase-EndoU-ColicinE5/D-RelE like nuclease 4 domain-containing protein n=1 Tax=Clostridium muellerianum TaxID=2716538 RepID=A0A7Y0HMP9_9CLOT|nr:PBECR4 domain-containing protein [Clostridium muellerianum]NMM61201.1 hypothetical protein [Clostridium muellerianum]
MDKQEALKIIISCAKLYQQNLENTNLLIVSLKTRKVNFLEAKFLRGNYLHLAGVVTNNGISAQLFYQKCLNNKLSLKDFEFKGDGTTPLKLSVLPNLMNIHKSLNMIGDFNGSKPKLYADKLTGNIMACIGLTKSGAYYAPCTTLKEDIRPLINNQERVIAVFLKNMKEQVYTSLTYIAKGFNNIEVEKIPVDILNKIDIDNIKSSFKITFVKSNNEENETKEQIASDSETDKDN